MINAGYRYRNDTVRYDRDSGNWVVGGGDYGVPGINRDWIDYEEVSLNPSLNDEPDRGIFLQIVFKGLGGVIGTKVETFLDEGIQGYREREDQAF